MNNICVLTMFCLFFASNSAKAAGTFGDNVKQGMENFTESVVDVSKKAGKQVTDASITSEVKTKLLADEKIKAYKINVDTKRRVVYLKGSVPNKESKDRAISKARKAKGVRQVVDQLRIEPNKFQ
jgi:osmotically-inducible protein OsmY